MAGKPGTQPKLHKKNLKASSLYNFTKEDLLAIQNGTYDARLEKELNELISCACARVGSTIKHCSNDEWVSCRSEGYLKMVTEGIPKLLANDDFHNSRSYLICSFIYGFRTALDRIIHKAKYKRSMEKLVTNLGHFEAPECGMSQGEVLEEMTRLYGKKLPSPEEIEDMP